MLKRIYYLPQMVTSIDNNGKEIGFIDYYYSVDEDKNEMRNPIIKHFQLWREPSITKLTPSLIKDTLELIIEFFTTKNISLLEFIVHKDNPVKFACRAFCEIMGGKRSDKIYFNSENGLIDENIWEEYIITDKNFLENNFSGTINDIIKLIVIKTNTLKRQYKKNKEKKMKYKRMVCFVNPQEREGINKVVNDQLPLIFAKDYNNFKDCLHENDYLVLSIQKANKELVELKSLLNNFKQYKFHFIGHLDGEGFSPEEFEILDEENAVSIPYDIEELLLEASGKIDNIFQKRGIPVRGH